MGSDQKIGIAFSAAPISFVLAQKLNLLNGNHLLVLHKKYGPAKIFLEPVEGQGIGFLDLPKDRREG